MEEKSFEYEGKKKCYQQMKCTIQTIVFNATKKSGRYNSVFFNSIRFFFFTEKGKGFKLPKNTPYLKKLGHKNVSTYNTYLDNFYPKKKKNISGLTLFFYGYWTNQAWTI